MFPYLTILDREIPLFSVMALAGMLAALFYVRQTKGKYDFPEQHVELALVCVLIGAFAGAKLLYLLTVTPGFIADLPYAFSQFGAFTEKYVKSGFVFYGGLCGGLVAAYLYCKRNKLSYYALCRRLLPILPLFHAFGRIGCFCMGCCYGRPSARFGIAFTHSRLAPNGVPLLPVQLIEATGEFLLFFILAHMSKRENSGARMLSLWLTAYGLLRFMLECFRGDAARGFIGALSVSQALSIACVCIGAFIWLRACRRCAARPDRPRL